MGCEFHMVEAAVTFGCAAKTVKPVAQIALCAAQW